MREIKFRAWDGKKMHYQVRFGGVKDGIPLSPSGWDEKYGWTILSGNPVLEIMQFTGLYDKNFKEIYEGDIVRAWSEGYSGVFKIEWRQDGVPCWMLYPSWKNDEFWYLHGVEHKGGQYHDTGIEVLGNVFENPELLKEESK